MAVVMYSFTHSEKIQNFQSAWKIMLTVFWDGKGLLLIEFYRMRYNYKYSQLLWNSRNFIITYKKMQHMLIKHALCLLPATYPKTYWILLDRIFFPPLYSFDLTPSKYHLFIKLKWWDTFFLWRCDERCCENLVAGGSEEVYNTGMQKLIPRLQKCVDLDSEQIVIYTYSIYTFF